MLKITYLEDGIYLESLQQSVESWKDTRILVSLRATANIYIEPSTASIVLPVNIDHLTKLAELEARRHIEINLCDEEYMEISLAGTWIAQSSDSQEGVFVCELDSSSEYFLAQIWQECQIAASMVSE